MLLTRKFMLFQFSVYAVYDVGFGLALKFVTQEESQIRKRSQGFLCFVRKVCHFAMKGLPKGETGIDYIGKERPSPMTSLHNRPLSNSIERRRFTTSL